VLENLSHASKDTESSIIEASKGLAVHSTREGTVRQLRDRLSHFPLFVFDHRLNLPCLPRSRELPDPDLAPSLIRAIPGIRVEKGRRGSLFSSLQPRPLLALSLSLSFLSFPFPPLPLLPDPLSLISTLLPLNKRCFPPSSLLPSWPSPLFQRLPPPPSKSLRSEVSSAVSLDLRALKDTSLEASPTRGLSLSR